MNDEPRKRTRRRSAALQIQEILNSARRLDDEPTSELSIARMKFLQTRLNVLSQMQARENNQTLERAIAEVESLRIENERLRQELAQALAGTNSTASRRDKVTGAVTAEINEALAKYRRCETQEGKE